MGKTGFELFTDRNVVAMRVNGDLKDLAAETTDTDTVEPITIDSPDGLNILRHSAAPAAPCVWSHGAALGQSYVRDQPT